METTETGYDKVIALLAIIISIIHEIDMANLDGKITWKEWLSIITGAGSKLILVINSFNDAWAQLKALDFQKAHNLANEVDSRLSIRNARTEKYIEMAIRMLATFKASAVEIKGIKVTS